MNTKKYIGLKKALHMMVVLMVGLMTWSSCSEQEDSLQAEYGYVQFKLYKSTTELHTRATTQLDYLSDARKIKVMMRHEGATIVQTVLLNAYNDENAAYGVRSDKLQLLTGDYVVMGYQLYDRLDQELLSATVTGVSFTIISNGLVVQPLTVNVAPRGKASFRLVKRFQKTRAEEQGAYPFKKIQRVSLSMKNITLHEQVDIQKIKVTYEDDFNKGSFDESLYPGKNGEIGYADCDTIVWLRAGKYVITGYTTYSDKKGNTVLETVEGLDADTFTVVDNQLTEHVKVGVRLSETAEHIKDYMALKEIWLALDGPHWKYYGEAEAKGCNWNFNKEIDLWGEQPGVELDNDGRVAALSLAGMGARGVVPDAIGQLTELRILSLGTHDELLGGHLFDNMGANISTSQLKRIRSDYADKFLCSDAREGLSDILKEAINRDESQRPISLKARASVKTVRPGNYTNQITGISSAVKRLTMLQQLYIANSPITKEGFDVPVGEDSPFYDDMAGRSWNDLKSLTDVEIYNCPKLTGLPLDMLTGIPELEMLNIACNKGISADQLKSDWEALIDGNSGKSIQVIYMGFNNLKEFPTTDYLQRMENLSMLDCTNNQIETLHPFGKKINISKFFLDYNKIKQIPHDAEGYFFGYFDAEGFSCSHNLLTEVPDIFNAKSNNVIGSVDFSNNQITSFENGDAHRGINANSVSLSNNRLKQMPSVLFKTGSPIGVLMLSGNGMEEIPEGSMKGKMSHLLSTIDLTFNKLKKLPKDFWATNMPYLYGLDVSYNCFSQFPVEPFDGSYLTTFGIRHQRDAEGNRILREWPTGIYNCPSLAALFMGSNDLRKIEDKISPYIYLFEIKDNPNISIDLTNVCPYIEAGAYKLFYDKTQDIRGCDILGIEK